jgi:hypothetical protein
MSLADLFLQLRIQAERTGEDRRLDLKNGARLSVRVLNEVVTLTISRQKKRVGDTELITFRRDCNVPDGAARYPAKGQNPREVDGVTWWCITYRWREEITE